MNHQVNGQQPRWILTGKYYWWIYSNPFALKRIPSTGRLIWSMLNESQWKCMQQWMCSYPLWMFEGCVRITVIVINLDDFWWSRAHFRTCRKFNYSLSQKKVLHHSGLHLNGRKMVISVLVRNKLVALIHRSFPHHYHFYHDYHQNALSFPIRALYAIRLITCVYVRSAMKPMNHLIITPDKTRNYNKSVLQQRVCVCVYIRLLCICTTNARWLTEIV